MNTYLILIRGINVGGNNIVSMTELRKCLDNQGFTNVATYIASGNVILQSTKPANEVRSQVETILCDYFKLDNRDTKVLILTYKQFKAIIDNKPQGFGEQPEEYHCDAIFLMDIAVPQAMTAFDPRVGVDKYWPGDGVIYSRRLSSQRTKSHLNRAMSTPQYQFMTIRNWNTTTNLFEILKQLVADSAA